MSELSESNKSAEASESLDFHKLIEGVTELVMLEKRSEPRHSHAMSIVVQPLDDRLQPVSKSFPVTTKDVSKSGMSFVHREPCSSRYIQINVQHRPEKLNARVCYKRPIGEGGEFYLIGVELIG